MAKERPVKVADEGPLKGLYQTPRPGARGVVLAHGFGADRTEHGAYTALARALGRAGFATLRFDFRAHGQSGGDHRSFHVAGQMEDLGRALRWMRARGHREVAVVGASLGGAVVTHYAGRRGGLRAVVLWNPVLDFGRTFLRPRDLRSRLALLLHKPRILRELRERGWFKVPGKDVIVGRRLVRDFHTRKPWKDLARIRVPALILHGDRDDRVSLGDSRKFLPLLRRGELVVVHGSGHGFHDPRGERFAVRATARWLARHVKKK
jgi:hypothetical protein